MLGIPRNQLNGFLYFLLFFIVIFVISSPQISYTINDHVNSRKFREIERLQEIFGKGKSSNE